MLNIIWPAFIIISVLFAILMGKIDDLNSSIFESASTAVQMIITFFGTICLWNGIIKILQETSLMTKLTRVINPIIKWLFPKIKKDSKEYKQITINVAANILGLGNAATPLGLAAMRSMQEKNTNKEELSDNMLMFIVINTASMQLIPTTVIAIRASLNSKAPTSIILPIWCATILAEISGIVVTKILLKKHK